MPAFKDITGCRHGRLVAKRKAGHDKHKVILWLWRCDCGKEIERVAQPIVSGIQVSCGCHRDEQTRMRAKKHGKADTPIYKCWCAMKARVLNANHPSAKHYHDRGITIHPEWIASFEAFHRDMGDCPEGMSIDRINNAGNYEPGNCRWATQRDQVANTRRTIFVEHNGAQRCLKHACAEAGFNYNAVRSRIRMGATPQEAFRL